MPRAVDRYQMQAEGDPNISGTEFHVANLAKDLLELLQEIVPQALEQMKQLITDFIKEITGIDLGSPEAFVTSVITFMTSPSASLQLVETLLSMLSGAIGVGSLTDVLPQILSAFQGIDLTGGPGAIMNAVADALADIPVIGDLAALIAGLVNGGQPVNAFNIFGSLLPNVFGLIPASAVGNTQPNLLANPLFANATSLLGLGSWLWDGTEGQMGLGSAKTTATGSVRKLTSNIIPVTSGQKFSLSAWTKWTGLSATGSPISLMLEVFNAAGEVIATPIIAAISSPGASSSWTQLTGTYTVPANAASVVTRLNVSETATAGTVWFDNISAKKTNLIGISLIADANGNGLPDIIDGLVDGTAFQQLKDALSGIGGGGLADIIARLEGFLTPGSTLNGSNIGVGSIADGFLPGVTSLLDNLGGIFSGLGGSGWTHSMTNAVLAQQSQVTTITAAKVAKLENAFTSGVTAADDFERSGSLGALWATVYGSGPGSWGTDGHNAYWIKVLFGFAERLFTARWLGENATSASDYQRITVVLATQPENSIGGTPGCNDVLGRMDSGGTNFIRARFTGTGIVTVSRVVSGVETAINSGSCPIPGPGANLTLECGKPGVSSRYFRAILNGSPVLEAPEAGTASMVGASYRGWGHGGKAGSNPFFLPVPTQNAPGRLKQWTAADQ